MHYKIMSCLLPALAIFFELPSACCVFSDTYPGVAGCSSLRLAAPPLPLPPTISIVNREGGAAATCGHNPQAVGPVCVCVCGSTC